MEIVKRKRWKNGTRVQKKCLICGKDMSVIMSLKDRKKVCSKECQFKLYSERLLKNNPFRKGTLLIREKCGVAYIRLNNSKKIAKIDSSDYDRIKKYCWKLHPNKDERNYTGKINYYVIARRFKGEKPKNVLLHRFILGIEEENANKSKKQIDHINRNGLDNRKSNLRIVTQSQNNHNMYKGAHGKYPCIRWNNTKNKFYGYIKIESKIVKTGEFNTPDEALKEYNKIRVKHLNNKL